MSVWYLELDDEITDAVARLRAAKDERVVLVVPPGSRIGTGRINFRLLAREAETRGLGIALVSGDAQVRALAASAGMAVFATVSESEAAEAKGTLTAGTPAEGTIDGAGSLTNAQTTSTAPGPLPGSGGATALPDPRWVSSGSDRTATTAHRPRRVSRRVGMTVGGLALVTLIGGGGLYGAYITIPRATITLVQQAHEVAPVALTLQVKEGQATDPATGVVGGVRLPVPVTVEGTVTASGNGDPIPNRASGTVTFTNHGPNPIPVADQTIVSTASGVTFETQGVIRVPAGGSTDVEVRAVNSGTAGNVDAGTITQMPDPLRRSMNGGILTNKAPTTGGDSQTQKVILQSDYDTAMADLNSRLQAALTTAAADPSGIPPDGVVYLTTVQPGEVTTSPPVEQVVGQPVASQSITASMTGSVLASSTSAITELATQMLEAKNPGTQFVANSIRVQTGEPQIGPDQVVAYSATASGRAYDRNLNPDDLKNAVKGKTVLAAQGILKDYGTATITLSPDFMPTLPDDPNRIEVNLTPLGSPAP